MTNAIDNQEDAEQQSAMALRARFMRLGLSPQHHQEIGVAQVADFDRRKADMHGPVVAAVRAAGGEQGASASVKPSEVISTIIEGIRQRSSGYLPISTSCRSTAVFQSTRFSSWVTRRQS
jgi:hypothetical protein